MKKIFFLKSSRLSSPLLRFHSLSRLGRTTSLHAKETLDVTKTLSIHILFNRLGSLVFPTVPLLLLDFHYYEDQCLTLLRLLLPLMP